MESLETFERDGFTVSLYQDEDPMSPKEWDQLGELVAFSPLWRDFTFADRESTGEEDEAYRRGGFPLLARYLRLTEGAEIIGFRFDDYGASGAKLYEEYDGAGAGFIMVDGEKIAEEYGSAYDISRLTARGVLSGELSEWGQYVADEVFGYVVKGPQGEVLDSAWGFYGYDTIEDEARSALAAAIDEEREEAVKISRAMAL